MLAEDGGRHLFINFRRVRQFVRTIVIGCTPTEPS